MSVPVFVTTSDGMIRGGVAIFMFVEVCEVSCCKFETIFVYGMGKRLP